jgi:hypothetical protein
LKSKQFRPKIVGWPQRWFWRAGGRMDGWMDGMMDGWMGVKPGLRDCLAQSKNKAPQIHQQKLNLMQQHQGYTNKNRY